MEIYTHSDSTTARTAGTPAIDTWPDLEVFGLFGQTGPNIFRASHSDK